MNSGYEVNGRWRNGKREGHGLICGPALEAKGIKIIWGKYRGGLLNGPAKVTLLDGDCTLEGDFVNGKLHGPVRGLTSRGMEIHCKTYSLVHINEFRSFDFLATSHLI